MKAHQKAFQVLGLGVGEAGNHAVKLALQDLLRVLAARAQDVPCAGRQEFQHHGFLDADGRERGGLCACGGGVGRPRVRG